MAARVSLKQLWRADSIADNILTINGNSTQSSLFYFTGLRLVTIVMVILTIIYILVDYVNDQYVTVMTNSYLPLIMMITLIGVILFRFKTAPLLFWCPLSWFLVGAVITFGFGSLLYYHANSDTIINALNLYHVSDIEILETNILNTVSIIFILFGYFIGVSMLTDKKGIVLDYKVSILMVKRLIYSLVLIYFPFEIFIHLPYLYGYTLFVVPGFLLTISKLGGVIIFLIFYLWGKGYKRYAYFGIFICLIELLLAMPSFGKGAMLSPFVFAVLGYYWATKNVKVFFYGIIVILALLFSIAMPISERGRADTYRYGSAEVSYAERIKIITDFANTDSSISMSNQSHEERSGIEKFWSRNSLNNVQSYLMNAYDTGNPGHSFDDVFVAMIPRILWPQKPIITDIGLELDAQVKNMPQSKSSLAPSFNGEAYWNGGWWMVGVVCTIIGIQFSQFAVYARKYMSQGDMRYLFIALLGIQFGGSIESWVIPKYVGGYLTTWCLWLIIKWLVPWEGKKVCETNQKNY